MCVCTFLFFFTWNSGLDRHSTAVVIKSSWTELYVVSACLCFAANHQWVIVDTNRPDFKEVKVQIKKWHKQLPDAMTIQPSLMSLFSHRITLQLVCFFFFVKATFEVPFHIMNEHKWNKTISVTVKGLRYFIQPYTHNADKHYPAIFTYFMLYIHKHWCLSLSQWKYTRRQYHFHDQKHPSAVWNQDSSHSVSRRALNSYFSYLVNISKQLPYCDDTVFFFRGEDTVSYLNFTAEDSEPKKLVATFKVRQQKNLQQATL